MSVSYTHLTSRSISLSGQSIINGITVETYNASVSETNPESMYINQSTVNHEMRKANRAQCRKDRDEFEELAYSIQAVSYTHLGIHGFHTDCWIIDSSLKACNFH